MKKLCWLIFVVIGFSCNSEIDYDYIKSTRWDYDSGLHVGGDFIYFEKDNLFGLHGDTIFYDDKPRAIIKNLDKKNFNLTIISLDGKEVGEYRDENESLEYYGK